VVEVTRTPEQTEALQSCCDRCHAQVQDVTTYVADIEGERKATIEHITAFVKRRTCRQCGSVQPEHLVFP
jgi:hypothetical protein